MDYGKDVSIDQNALDWEWLRQADLTLKYGEALAEARLATDQAKEAMDVEEAQAQNRVREHYLSTGSKMPTVDQVRAEVELDSLRRDAVEDFNQARYQQALVQAAFDAIQAKKSALENLVRLHGQQYFAGPAEPKQIGERVSMDKQATEAMKKRTAERTMAAARTRGK